MEIDFGGVEVGRTAIKSIEIYNESSIELLYQVQRDSITNSLDEVFILHNYSWKLSPHEKYICEICYRPFIAFCKNVDYFKIIDSSDVCIKIVTRGFSIGPKVTTSLTKVVMLSTTENYGSRKRIKLKNTSETKALYMFDIDNNCGPFKVDATHGFINPCSYKYVTITFIPLETGKFTYFLYGLILNSEPIFLELYGYHSSVHMGRNKIKQFNCKWKTAKGFDGYMSDSINAIENIPPISLAKNYFDFGQTDAGGKTASIPQVVCITNHGSLDVNIRWQQDDDNILDIATHSMRVKAGQSSFVEIHFNPNVESNVFSRNLIASVFTEAENDIKEESSEFPFVTSVRIIGHSFPSRSYGWIPQYEIPQIVKMPPCIPPFPSYRTFLIKKFGHLPLMFQFVAPRSSRFRVKPMVGVIHEDYQIIVVQLIPKPEDQQFYMERWLVYLNGNQKNEIYIDFKGYAEYPKIMVCENNSIKFPPVYPSCREVKQIQMRNITRYDIKYEFFQLPVELKVPITSGVILSNEILLQDWSFCPLSEKIDYDFDVQCALTVFKDETSMIPKTWTTVRVTGSGEKGTLVAVPSELNFGEQEYDSTKTLSFYLFNLSPVDIHYAITCDHRNWPIGDIKRDVNIQQTMKTVLSGGYEIIHISVKPRTLGYYQFVIQYFVRVSSQSEDLVPNQMPKNICEVNSMCTLPILQVKDLHFSGCYSNISSYFLWNSLELDKLNVLLKNMLPEETKTFNMNFGPVILNEDTACIKLIISNSTRITASWKLKRIKSCSCKTVNKNSFSFRPTAIDCIHENICSIEPTAMSLKSKEQAELNIRIKYKILGKTDIKWNLDVGHDRHIILNIIIECLSNSDEKLHMCGPNMNFGEVYIGEKDAIYQTHWIRNCTEFSLPYTVDVSKLHEINSTYDCEIFFCKTTHGRVEPQSMVPIMIKFQPRLSNNYEVTLPVHLGNIETQLTLKGEGSYNSRLEMQNRIPRTLCSGNTDEFSIYFSTHCIELRSVSTHNSLIKMLLIRNDFKQYAVTYEWESGLILGVIEVKVYPSKGIIQPKMVQSFRVEINTKGCPCKIDLDVPCKFVNITTKRNYNRSILKYRVLEKELEGQFNITQKGTEIPKNWMKLLEKPETLYKTITVHCCIRNPESEANLLEELKALPYIKIKSDIVNKLPMTEEDAELSVSSLILENMLWEITNSKVIRNIIEETLISKSDLNYSQFIMNLSERKKQINRSYISPPDMFTDWILENMLFSIVHEEFALETVHLIPEEDIRHVNYFKLISRDKPNISKIGVRELQDDIKFSDIPKSRSKVTVAFTED